MSPTISSRSAASTDAEGKTPAGVRNRLAIFVAGITHDTMARGVPGPGADAWRGARAVSPMPVHLTVHLMLASSFDPENYLESLKILSHAVQFFQVHPVFDRISAPEMDRAIEQLSLEIENLDTDGVSQLWGILGGRYLPSVLYRMRTVTIDAGALTAETLVIRAPARAPRRRRAHDALRAAAAPRPAPRIPRRGAGRRSPSSPTPPPARLAARPDLRLRLADGVAEALRRRGPHRAGALAEDGPGPDLPAAAARPALTAMTAAVARGARPDRGGRARDGRRPMPTVGAERTCGRWSPAR